MRVATFYALLLGVALYAVRYGRAPERIGAVIMLLGTVAGHLAWSTGPDRLLRVESGALAVDLAALAALVALALFTDRTWTLWLAALQLIGTLAHVARAIDPGMMPTGYAFLLVVWSYPMLLVIALGTRTQQKKRLSEPVSGSWPRS